MYPPRQVRLTTTTYTNTRPHPKTPVEIEKSGHRRGEKSDKCFAFLRYRRVGIQLVHRLKISPDIGPGPAEIVPHGVCGIELNRTDLWGTMRATLLEIDHDMLEIERKPQPSIWGSGVRGAGGIFVYS